MDKATILAKLKQVKPDLQHKYGLSEIALFGSYSRDEQTPESDIDLLVNFERISARNFFDCVFMLEDAFPEKEVQIVTRGGIKPKYFEAIKSDLIYV
jgi:uncharacterized protein